MEKDDDRLILDDDEEDEEEDIFGLDEEDEEESSKNKDISPPSETKKDEKESSDKEKKSEENGSDDEDDIMKDIFGEISDEEEEKPVLYEIPEGIPTLRNHADAGPLIKLKLPPSINFIPKPYEIEEDPPLEQFPNLHFRYVYNESGDGFVTDEHGAVKKESNSQIVKWSDGSYQLRIGKEFYDITDTDNRLKKSRAHIYYRGRDHGFYLEQGKLDRSFVVRSKLGKAGSRSVGPVEADVFQRQTKLTDKVLDYDVLKESQQIRGGFGGGGGGSVMKDVKKLKEKQASRLKRLLRKKREKDEEGVDDIRQLKKDIRSGKRDKKKRRRRTKGAKGGRRTGKKRKRASSRRRGKKNGGEDEYEEDDFVVGGKGGGSGDGDDLIVDDEESDESDELSGGYSSSEEEMMEELQLYEDESGSDSDETFRPYTKKRKLK